MRPWPLLLLVGCVGTKAGAAHPPHGAGSGAPMPGGEVAIAVLGPDGLARTAGQAFVLERPEEGAELGRVLARSAGGETLRIRVTRGTPTASVQRLLAVLQAAGLDDYRLDLGQ